MVGVITSPRLALYSLKKKYAKTSIIKTIDKRGKNSITKSPKELCVPSFANTKKDRAMTPDNAVITHNTKLIVPRRPNASISL